jgi:hypothetical protein
VSSANPIGAQTRTLADRPWVCWLLSRIVGLGLGGLAVAMVRGNVYFDTTYYGQWAHGTLNGYAIPYRDFAWEYPPGALPAMLIPGLYAPLLPTHPPTHLFFGLYGVLWVGWMLAVDASVWWFLLRRSGGSIRHPAMRIWLYGLPLLGALTWARYDLLPAATSLVAVVSAGVGLKKRSGLFAGLGGTLKIWPVLLAPIQRTRRSAITATVMMLIVMLSAAGITWLATGETGFAQVLHYQTKRGLQIESIVALPLVWLTHFHQPGYSQSFSYGAFQVAGPPAAALGHIVTAVYAVGLVILGLVHWRFMKRDADRRLVALTVVAFMFLTIVTNKVFSPQYLLWLLAVLAGACVLDPETWRPYIPWVLTVAGLTAIVFPWFYGDVLGTAWFGLIIMTIRDVLVLGLAIAVARRVWLELRTLQRTDKQDAASTKSSDVAGYAEV